MDAERHVPVESGGARATVDGTRHPASGVGTTGPVVAGSLSVGRSSSVDITRRLRRLGAQQRAAAVASLNRALGNRRVGRLLADTDGERRGECPAPRRVVAREAPSSMAQSSAEDVAAPAPDSPEGYASFEEFRASAPAPYSTEYLLSIWNASHPSMLEGSLELGYHAVPPGGAPSTVFARPEEQEQPRSERSIEDIPLSQYVDAFQVAQYNVGYRAVGGRSSTVLRLLYDDGVSIDVDWESIEEGELHSGSAMADILIHGYVGPGDRVFPRRLSPSTTPRLWVARQEALKILDEYNAEFILGTFPTWWSLMPVGPVDFASGQPPKRVVRLKSPEMPGEPSGPEATGPGAGAKQSQATGPKGPGSTGAVKKAAATGTTATPKKSTPGGNERPALTQPREAGEAAAPPANAPQRTLLQIARDAGVSDEIEGPIEVFAFGTTQESASDIVANKLGRMRTFAAMNIETARVFAARRVTNVKGSRPGVVGIALPKATVVRLKQQRLLHSEPMTDPPPELSRRPAQWIIEPDAIQAFNDDGFFFLIE